MPEEYFVFYCHFLSRPRSISFATLRRHCHKSIDNSKLVNAAGPDKARYVSKAYVTPRYYDTLPGTTTIQLIRFIFFTQRTLF